MRRSLKSFYHSVLSSIWGESSLVFGGNLSVWAVLFLVLSLSACRPKGTDGVFVLSSEPQTVRVLHAPWDGLDDETEFTCYVKDGRLCFSFVIVDSTMTVSEDFPKERTVDDEDRGEVFFSCDSLMSSYWCAEIDPKGRPMDYAAHFGQPFDYEWNFSTLQAQGSLTEKGYRVDASVALSELRELGIDTKDFYMGVFRADFHPDMTVNWYSLVSTDDKSPYFHKPNVLFPATIRE